MKCSRIYKRRLHVRATLKTKAHSAAQEISTLIPPFRPPGNRPQTLTSSQEASPPSTPLLTWAIREKSIGGEINLLAAVRKERRAGAL